MYNEELKKEYLSVRARNGEPVRLVFEAISKYEEAWQADICTRSKEEIQEIIDSVVGLRSSSFLQRVNILKDYVRWCIDRGVPGATDGMLYINQAGLGKIATQTVGSPLHLQRYLNQVFKPNTEGIDCIYKSYLWLAYSGMREPDIMLVESDCLDFDNMIIRFKDDEYPIYKEAIQPLKVCALSPTFVYEDDLKRKVYTRVDGNRLLRGYRATASYKTVRSEISRRIKAAIDSKKTNLSISHYRAWISGVFYRTYEAECAGLPANFLYVAQEHMAEKENPAIYDKVAWSAKRNYLANEYLRDYNRWKAVFYSNII